MTDKEKRELNDGVISIFERFNILDHTATIGGLRDDILRYINSVQEEPVSKPIDFEQELYKAFGQIKDFTLGIAIAKRFYDMGRKHNEPVSEELGKAAVEAFKEIVDDGRNSFLEIFKAGADWKITKLMANATDVTVHIDAGGYPYIPQMELYDYDKDLPLAKEGDRYKVVLIKEN